MDRLLLVRGTHSDTRRLVARFATKPLQSGQETCVFRGAISYARYFFRAKYPAMSFVSSSVAILVNAVQKADLAS